MQSADEKYMRMCLRLAVKGAGKVSPNPMVGCVIVKDGRVIGKGWHKRYGDAHAEVNAVASALKKVKDLRGCHLYVNLEPCAHKGKTGSCARMLTDMKPARVIIGCKDPYPPVNGRGIRILRNAGIEVNAGVLEEESRALNKFFMTFVEKKRPYVTLKVAQSADGIIALGNGSSKYITSESARYFVHKMRSEYDAVLIGRNTALKDDPLLDARLAGKRSPLRLVIDEDLTLPGKLRVFNDENADRTIVITSGSAKRGKQYPDVRRIHVRKSGRGLKIESILNAAWQEGISSILVEGGAGLFSSFVASQLFDDIYFMIAPRIIGRGLSAFEDLEIRRLDDAYRLALDRHYINESNELIVRYKNVYWNS
ncbi:MAG: bifunctional diaminohydroxyphosphoribosylaminopyrimidine deaminase/5-amino-6-(5-phosphoribosylamino)uracil reductase RibD [Ignavibacteria bacterium]|nr:bifunctional diaminohydroxyphosphoribosylaminopyrimidine deaminase/5-amino-6-(5-phosphoribosylamino)uracil reductase RibD [Ignavibacteria bacterium]